MLTAVYHLLLHTIALQWFPFKASYYDEDAKEKLLSEKLKISPFDVENPNKHFIQVTLENESPVLQVGSFRPFSWFC